MQTIKNTLNLYQVVIREPELFIGVIIFSKSGSGMVNGHWGGWNSIMCRYFKSENNDKSLHSKNMFWAKFNDDFVVFFFYSYQKLYSFTFYKTYCEEDLSAT